jgi:hypothetical protein
MVKIAVCCQNMPVGALINRSAISMLVGALFKKFGLFLNTLCKYETEIVIKNETTAIHFLITTERVFVWKSNVI